MVLLLATLLCFSHKGACWGFYAHQKINYYAVFLLPPRMLPFYKSSQEFLSLHAVDPDKRRYLVAEEGPRHYIDLDRYPGLSPDSVRLEWRDAVKRFSEDSLSRHGILPWWIESMYRRLVAAFKEGDADRIRKLSADIGHYIGDAHVPLHTSSNHNGQLTGQTGIHGFWESRIPELLAERSWNFFTGKARYIDDIGDFIWQRIFESARASDSVLLLERILSARFPSDQKFAYEQRQGKLVRQYAASFTAAFDQSMNGMVERRMRGSIMAVASFWYSAWVDAGQPGLPAPSFPVPMLAAAAMEYQQLDLAWKKGEMIGRRED